MIVPSIFGLVFSDDPTKYVKYIILTLIVISRCRSELYRDYQNAKIYFKDSTIQKEINSSVVAKIEPQKLTEILKTMTAGCPQTARTFGGTNPQSSLWCFLRSVSCLSRAFGLCGSCRSLRSHARASGAASLKQKYKPALRYGFSAGQKRHLF